MPLARPLDKCINCTIMKQRRIAMKALVLGTAVFVIGMMVTVIAVASPAFVWQH